MLMTRFLRLRTFLKLIYLGYNERKNLYESQV